jgi:hypothetical protein
LILIALYEWPCWLMHSETQVLDVPKSLWPHSSRRAENHGDAQHILEPHRQAPIQELAFYDVTISSSRRREKSRLTPLATPALHLGSF